MIGSRIQNISHSTTLNISPIMWFHSVFIKHQITVNVFIISFTVNRLNMFTITFNNISIVHGGQFYWLRKRE